MRLFWATWALAGLLAGSLGYHAVQHLERRSLAEDLALARTETERPAPDAAPEKPPAPEPVEPLPPLVASPRMGCGRGGAMGQPGCALERLDLSPGQRASLSACCARNQESENALGEEFRSQVSALHGELEKDEPDRAAIARMVDRLCAIRRRVLEGKIEAVLEVKGTLTREQMDRLLEAAGSDQR